MERELGTIERGIIKEKTEQGYRVASLDREGIETPPIRPIEYDQAGTNGQEYSTGDRVYFFHFHDGTGRIICEI